MMLQGKTALVTGASRGIGRAIALRLARDGSAVGINYRERASAAESLATEVRNAGGRALPVAADIGDARAVVPGMQARRFGRIVNLTSIAAHGTAMAGTTFYAATKAAVSVLTRRFAMDLGPHGITVNAIAPGFILTDLVAAGRGP